MWKTKNFIILDDGTFKFTGDLDDRKMARLAALREKAGQAPDPEESGADNAVGDPSGEDGDEEEGEE